jgi:hypothetical protein
VFNDLGAYYAQQLANGSTHNENDFYQLIAKNIHNHKHINGNLLLKANKSLLSAPVLGCNNELGNHIFDTITPIAKLTPFGDSLGAVTELGKALFNWGCPSDSAPDYTAQLDQINEKLADIQASISDLAGDMQELTDLVQEQAFGKDQVVYRNLLSKEDIYNSIYLNYMAEVNNGRSAESSYKSLYSYAVAKGGVDNLDKQALPLFATDNGVLNGMANQYSNLQKIYNNIPYISTLLNEQCSNIDIISGDIIAKRNYCNTYTIQLGMQLAAAIHQSRLRMADAIATILTSKEPGNYTNPFGAPGSKGIPWSEAAKLVESDFDANMESINTFYKNTLITPTNGLPTDLLNKLNESGNPLSCDPATSSVSGVTGLLEWHANDNGKLATNDRYIITKCKQIYSDHSDMITSRYYYNSDGTKVKNILGTLVGINAMAPRNDTFEHLKNGYTVIRQQINYDVMANAMVASAQPYWTSTNYPVKDVIGSDKISDFAQYKNSDVINKKIPSLWKNDNNTQIPVNGIVWYQGTTEDFSLNKYPYNASEFYGFEALKGGMYVNLWLVKAWTPGTDANLVSQMIIPLAYPFTLKDGTTQWVTFGFYLYQNVSYQGVTTLHATVECTTLHNCRAEGKADAGQLENRKVPAISFSLQDGSDVDIRFIWNSANNGFLDNNVNPSFYLAR